MCRGLCSAPGYNRTQDRVCPKGRGVLVCTESAWRRCWSRLSASNSNAYVSQADAMCVLGTGQQEMVGTVAKRRGRVLWRAAPSPSCYDGQPEEMPAQGYHIWISNRSWKSSSCGISHLEKHCVGQTEHLRTWCPRGLPVCDPFELLDQVLGKASGPCD